jgi:hypothetical protein
MSSSDIVSTGNKTQRPLYKLVLMILKPEHALRIPAGKKWLENRHFEKFFTLATNEDQLVRAKKKGSKKGSEKKGSKKDKRSNEDFDPLDPNSWVLPVMTKNPNMEWSQQNITDHTPGLVTSATQISHVLSHSEVKKRIKAGDFPDSFGPMLLRPYKVAAIFDKYIPFPGAKEADAIMVDWTKLSMRGGQWLVRIPTNSSLYEQISDRIQSSMPVFRDPSRVTKVRTQCGCVLGLVGEWVGGRWEIQN